MISEQAPASGQVAPPDPNRPTVIVVMGAGRSGTSAITRALVALGVDLGDNQRAGSGKNPTGFFEDNDILATSSRLKKALGIRGHSLRLIDEAEFNKPLVQAIQQRAITRLGQRFGRHDLWGYKYARTLRTLPFWQGIHEALDLDVRYLLALRNPMSVARSRARINPQRGRQVWSDMEWLVNVVPYFDRTAGRPRTVVDFDRLLADPEKQVHRIARDLGLPCGPAQQAGIEAYSRQFLQKDKPATHFTRKDLQDNPDVYPWVAEGYTLLDEVAADELSLDSAEFARRWARVEQAVDDLGPLLAEFDHLRQRIVTSRWNPLSIMDELGQIRRNLQSR